MSWRFHLQSLPSLEWLDRDLPLGDGEVVETINAPLAIRGTLPLGYRNLVSSSGKLLLREWGCQIVAEQPGFDPVVGIVDGISTEGDHLQIEAGGFTMYPTGMPWFGPEFTGIKVDPLDMVRKIWTYLQTYSDGYKGVTVDGTKSPIRIGVYEDEEGFIREDGTEARLEGEPFKLAHWVTDDLGKVLSDLAENTPFQYRERSRWVDDNTLAHRLELGYPKLGSRKDRLHFEIGMNVVVSPPVEEGDYASEVFLVGTGEGRKRVTGHITADTGRLRRVAVRTDKSLRERPLAAKAARQMLDRLKGEYSVDTLEIIDHSLAPYSSWDVGDEIRVQGDAGWIQLDRWVRILEISTSCVTGRRIVKVEDA